MFRSQLLKATQISPEVTAIQLMVDETMPSLDARISGIGLTGANPVSFPLVPEPSGAMLCLMGLGLLRCVQTAVRPRGQL